LPILDHSEILDDFPRVSFENCEVSGRRIESIQTVVGGDPERSTMVDKKACYDVVA
jgi:hypothetical protein